MGPLMKCFFCLSCPSSSDRHASSPLPLYFFSFSPSPLLPPVVFLSFSRSSPQGVQSFTGSSSLELVVQSLAPVLLAELAKLKATSSSSSASSKEKKPSSPSSSRDEQKQSSSSSRDEKKPSSSSSSRDEQKQASTSLTKGGNEPPLSSSSVKVIKKVLVKKSAPTMSSKPQGVSLDVFPQNRTNLSTFFT